MNGWSVNGMHPLARSSGTPGSPRTPASMSASSLHLGPIFSTALSSRAPSTLGLHTQLYTWLPSSATLPCRTAWHVTSQLMPSRLLLASVTTSNLSGKEGVQKPSCSEVLA
eukprot:CAMPEP_0202897370 /NCGR_PEP_ID=MMETSP1392-20130828/6144_1 /ASSEMBLY_ACC=CAM_ASM_000868 /TAXON_ID=225041 /ORGANISM="Chlamydomonas chlamydogama, Strain SAG 11-48b" /LENGTH=110 /DNA_ID=CAMNT_0049582979 /DNA_START=161 /DNA_END=489 /DNA_ORIENTATION=-